jgi:hypothetical protein
MWQSQLHGMNAEEDCGRHRMMPACAEGDQRGADRGIRRSQVRRRASVPVNDPINDRTSNGDDGSSEPLTGCSSPGCGWARQRGRVED